MYALIIFLVCALAAALCVLTWLHVGVRRKLARFQQIQDIEAYQSSCEASANAALQQSQNLEVQANALNEQLAAQKNRVAQYQQLLGKFQSAAELHQRIKHDTARVQQLATN
jgi:hypothetical protein